MQSVRGCSGKQRRARQEQDSIDVLTLLFPRLWQYLKYRVFSLGARSLLRILRKDIKANSWVSRSPQFR
jgi:hypothetical protein